MMMQRRVDSKIAGARAFTELPSKPPRLLWVSLMLLTLFFARAGALQVVYVEMDSESEEDEEEEDDDDSGKRSLEVLQISTPPVSLRTLFLGRDEPQPVFGLWAL